MELLTVGETCLEGMEERLVENKVEVYLLDKDVDDVQAVMESMGMGVRWEERWVGCCWPPSPLLRGRPGSRGSPRPG